MRLDEAATTSPQPGDKIIEGSCGEADGYACIRRDKQLLLMHQNLDTIVHAMVDLRGGQPTAIRRNAGGNPFLGDPDLYAMVPRRVAIHGGDLLAAAVVNVNCDAAKKYHAICLDGLPPTPTAMTPPPSRIPTDWSHSPNWPRSSLPRALQS